MKSPARVDVASLSSTKRLTRGPGSRTLSFNQQVEDWLLAEPLSKIFAALADPTRRDIVTRLAEADATVGELAEPYDVSVQAISKHLKVLEEAGLVTKTPVAQQRSVHLEADVLDLMSKWIERYRAQAEQRYRRLDAVLADMDESTQRHEQEQAS